ncbi:MAG: aminopeptidase P N-terminal domain-containing protein [Armatimonadetes bacterium]|nr:aminopeptidase P N-terminal domain-containing protein [Armatimonadota bacterium]
MRFSLGLFILGFGSFCQAQLSQEPFWTWVPDKSAPPVFQARRERLRSLMPAGGIGVFFTNPEQARNNDVDFAFRPDSNFLYLTGFEEPDSAVIVAKDGITVDGKLVHEVLFCNNRDAGAETWTGYRFGPDRAQSAMGYELAVANDRFKAVLDGITPFSPRLQVLSPDTLPGRNRYALSNMITAFQAWAATNKDKLELTSRTGKTLGAMRFVKDSEEIRLMKKACEISALSHVEVMKSCKPTSTEFELSALMEYGFKKHGCEYIGYPNIVGSGGNSCVLHYEKNERTAKNGDLVLMDCAGEYHGYSSDVTRTFPVNGKYTTEQRAIYDLVYEAQEAGIQACKSGSSFNTPHQVAAKILGDGLIKLGIIKTAGELGRYFMHGTSHSIGLDVHDLMTSDSTLRPGVMLTVEPGIYIKEGSPCDKKWWNIGVRIEDDILVTEKGPVNMSVAAPRTSKDVEKLMASKKK